VCACGACVRVRGVRGVVEWWCGAVKLRVRVRAWCGAVCACVCVCVNVCVCGKGGVCV